MQLSSKNAARLEQLLADGTFASVEEAEAYLNNCVGEALEVLADHDDYPHHTPEFLASLDEAVAQCERGEYVEFATADEAMDALWPKRAKTK